MSNEEEEEERIPKMHQLISKIFAVPSTVGENYLKNSRGNILDEIHIKIKEKLRFAQKIT